MQTVTEYGIPICLLVWRWGRKSTGLDVFFWDCCVCRKTRTANASITGAVPSFSTVPTKLIWLTRQHRSRCEKRSSWFGSRLESCSTGLLVAFPGAHSESRRRLVFVRMPARAETGRGPAGGGAASRGDGGFLPVSPGHRRA